MTDSVKIPPPQWEPIGSSVTTPPSNKQRKEVFVNIDKYYLTVGFEANYIDTAFKDNILKLTGVDADYGHAFFYVTKNDEVTTFLSFGPRLAGKIGWLNKGDRKPIFNTGAIIKNGAADARAGNPDYLISEVTRLFRIKINADQAKKIVIENTKMRESITNGKQKYTVYINDTCADTAKQVLDAAGLETPEASGKVMIEGKVSFFSSVNPYMWHHNFKKKGYKEIIYPQKAIEAKVKIKPLIVQEDGIHLKNTSLWILSEAAKDPLVVKGYASADATQ